MTSLRNYGEKALNTPQDEKIPGREDQVKNSAGGYVWELDKWKRLERFLVIGTDGGTYYIKEKDLVAKNAEVVQACLKEDGIRTVQMIVDISSAGRAVKNDYALFALAMAMTYGDAPTKLFAGGQLPNVARIGTHLFHFAQYVQNMRGWGRGLKRAVANWYDNSQRDLGYQLVKYQQRDGWSHADLIKLSHPKAHGDLYNWVLRGKPGHEDANIPDHKTIEGFVMLQGAGESYSAKQVAQAIRDYHLPREAVPNNFLDEAVVWEALLETDMGYEAMVRNLGNMGKAGLLKPMSAAAKLIVSRLGDAEAIKKARLHPLKILVGLRTYGQGHGFKGSNSWDVVSTVKDALEAAFYESFKHVEPSGQNTMLALDTSGSMSWGGPIPNFTCAELTAVMAMVTARVEPNYMITAFADGMKNLNISKSMSLDEVTRKVANATGGGTDCALPMFDALKKKLDIDTFVIYTDSETWAGRSGHPAQAVVKFRKEMNKPKAKLVVVGMQATEFTIADPNDPGMVDVVGFDTNTPEAIAAFQRLG